MLMPLSSLLRYTVLWFAGINLRVTLLAVPPVIPLINNDLPLDHTSIAALIIIPAILFAVASISGSLLIATVGARRALLLGLILMATASALRGVGPAVSVLFIMTIVMGAGIAIMQPALPTLVSHWFPRRIAFATAVYTNGLFVGQILSSSLTIPLVLPLVGYQWHLALAFWSLPAVLAVLGVVLVTRDSPETKTHGVLWQPPWGNGTMWKIGIIFASTAGTFFGVNAFIPEYLMASGRGNVIALALTAINVAQLPATFIVMIMPTYLTQQKVSFIVLGLFKIVAIAGIIISTGYWFIFWCAIIGFTCAFLLILCFSAVSVVAPGGAVHQFSAGFLTIAFTGSLIGPICSGLIWDITAQEVTAFVPYLFTTAILVASAMSLKLRGEEF